MLSRTLKNRVIREELPLSVLSLYGLPTSGIVPTPRSSADIIEIAKGLVSADAEAVLKGDEAMSNPSASQLEAALIESEKEIADAVDSDSKETDLATISDEADALIDEILAELRFNLRRESESDQRRIKRSYGVKFKDDVSAE